MSTTDPSEPRWRRRPDERPDEILSAALEVFAEHGLAGARVDDIAARAGVSKGTVYRYFPGKEELFREAVRDRVARTLTGLSSAAGRGEPEERLGRFVDAYWAHLRRASFPRFYRLLMAELHRFPDLTRFYAEEVSGRVIELVSAIIEEGVRAGRFRDADPTVTGRMIVGLLVQHAIWASHPDLFPHLDHRPDVTLLEEVKDFLFRSIVVRTAPSGDRPS